MDSEHRFSLCWIFCICKVFNNPNERDISLLGVVPRHQQTNYQPHSGSILSSLVSDTKSRLSKNLCGCLVYPFPSSKMFQNNILLYSHCHIPQRDLNNQLLTRVIYSSAFLASYSRIAFHIWGRTTFYIVFPFLLHSLVLNLRPLRTNGHTTFKYCVPG